jgi:hypothetical protein
MPKNGSWPLITSPARRAGEGRGGRRPGADLGRARIASSSPKQALIGWSKPGPRAKRTGRRTCCCHPDVLPDFALLPPECGGGRRNRSAASTPRTHARRSRTSMLAAYTQRSSELMARCASSSCDNPAACLCLRKFSASTSRICIAERKGVAAYTATEYSLQKPHGRSGGMAGIGLKAARSTSRTQNRRAGSREPSLRDDLPAPLRRVPRFWHLADGARRLDGTTKAVRCGVGRRPGRLTTAPA